MRFVAALTAGLAVCVHLHGASVPSSAVPSQKQKPPAFSKSSIEVPLLFERNIGQAPADAQFVSRTSTGVALIGSAGTKLLVRSSDGQDAEVRMQVRRAHLGAGQPEGAMPSYSNYLLGSDRSKWQRNVPHYSKIRYKNVYPGIELLYYGTQGRLEYDFVVAPGADYSVIELAFDGADRLRTDSNGDLLIDVAGTTIRQWKPKVYQTSRSGGKTEIAAAYRISNGGVRFALGRHDRSRELVI
ncbi:MAG TPA: hypothetical protein VEQ63_14200, partial [Bryobacteraceae bacterium]|nr:hypothetical protein [Bryobacteraceae bacterium]